MKADYWQVLKSFILDKHSSWHIAATTRIRILRPFSLQLISHTRLWKEKAQQKWPHCKFKMAMAWWWLLWWWLAFLVLKGKKRVKLTWVWALFLALIRFFIHISEHKEACWWFSIPLQSIAQQPPNVRKSRSAKLRHMLAASSLPSPEDLRS